MLGAIVPHFAACLLPSASAATQQGSLVHRATNSSLGNAHFRQLLDHGHPELGTFSQQYWYDSEHWKGPGAPIIFFTPGEAAAGPYFPSNLQANTTLLGAYAQEVGGAIVMLEHRYYGDSSPFDDLTTVNLKYMTLPNALADLSYIARTVDLPFDTNHSSNAPHAPWVLGGGSYGGQLAAWSEATAPGTFWAYHASSAGVQVISDFWQWFVPVQQGMARNCSKDLALAVDYIDKVLENGTSGDKTALKAMFGLAGLQYGDDFAMALANGTFLWQDHQFYTNYTLFYRFCDYIEGVPPRPDATSQWNSTQIPGAAGVGLEKALAGFAAWNKEVRIPGFCASLGHTTDKADITCLDRRDASNVVFTDRSVNNSLAINRAWQYMLCNEPINFWFNGPPASRPSAIQFRLVHSTWWTRQCPLYFPGLDVSDMTVDTTNAFTHGWSNRNATRLLHVDGEFDGWREAGVASDFRPGGPLPSTDRAPVLLVPKGVHTSDLYLRNGLVDEGVKQVQQRCIEIMKGWVQEFYDGKGTYAPKETQRLPGKA